jgi:hypothetical protein
MWDLFDQWIVLLAIGWAVWVIYKSLSRKAFLNCEAPCEKKIFKKEALVTIGTRLSKKL